MTFIAGKRRSSMFKTSRIAAPLGEVMTPTCLGTAGIDFLFFTSNNPSFWSLTLSCSKALRSSPSPISSSVSAESWNSPLPSYRLIFPRSNTFEPS